MQIINDRYISKIGSEDRHQNSGTTGIEYCKKIGMKPEVIERSGNHGLPMRVSLHLLLQRGMYFDLSVLFSQL